MKYLRVCTVLLLVLISLTPMVNAGLWDDVKETINDIDLFIRTVGETDYDWTKPDYYSYSGSVTNPELATREGEIDSAEYTSSAEDYATFAADEYGEIVFKNINDPFTRQYQANDDLYFSMGCNASAGDVILRCYRDDGVTYDEYTLLIDTESGIASSFDHNVSYFDTNEDGIITIELIHPSSEPEMQFMYLEVYQRINTSIPEPETDDDTSESTTSSGGSSSGYVSSVQTTDDTSESTSDENTTTLANVLLGTTEPVYTIPGFESVFAICMLLIVAFVHGRKE